VQTLARRGERAPKPGGGFGISRASTNAPGTSGKDLNKGQSDAHNREQTISPARKEFGQPGAQFYVCTRLLLQVRLDLRDYACQLRFAHLLPVTIRVKLARVQALERRAKGEIIFGRRQMQRSAHHRCSDDLSLLKQLRQVRTLKRLQTTPQADIRGIG
jgi:hypothetical protein